MKKKVTQKQVKAMYKNVVRVGYCELQALLRTKEPKFYTAGVYGWNADIYEVDNNTCIVTGYRPFGNIEGYEVGKEFEEEARKVIKLNYDWDKIDNKLSELLDQFVKEAIRL